VTFFADHAEAVVVRQRIVGHEVKSCPSLFRHVSWVRGDCAVAAIPTVWSQPAGPVKGLAEADAAIGKQATKATRARRCECVRLAIVPLG